GVADWEFYDSLHRFLARTNAPIAARASVDFMHGLAAWDYGEASRAADPLLAAARAGDLWLDPDVLRDGAVMAKLATGDRGSSRSRTSGSRSSSSTRCFGWPAPVVRPTISGCSSRWRWAR